MTQAPVDLKAEIVELVRSNPVPIEFKHSFRVNRLERMKRFYEDKAPEAPEVQGVMFNDFIVALAYAKDMLAKYDDLTKALALLAEGGSNENRTNSTGG